MTGGLTRRINRTRFGQPLSGALTQPWDSGQPDRLPRCGYEGLQLLRAPLGVAQEHVLLLVRVQPLRAAALALTDVRAASYAASYSSWRRIQSGSPGRSS